jgi:hypothetical protein
MHRDTRRPIRPRGDPCRSCGCPVQGDLGAYCEACEADDADVAAVQAAMAAEAMPPPVGDEAFWKSIGW